jgi:hypothetical protein
VRSLPAPGLELVHYPSLTREWRGIPEAYTWFTLIESLAGDVDDLSRGNRARCEPGSVTIGEPGEPYLLRQISPMLGDFRLVRVDHQEHDAVLEETGVQYGVRARITPSFLSGLSPFRADSGVVLCRDVRSTALAEPLFHYSITENLANQ